MYILRFLLDVLFSLSSFYCIYLLFFAIASKINATVRNKESRPEKKILVLIPAYAEDRVIFEAVDSFLKQDYPRGHYEICVISDHMQEETNQKLAGLPIRLEIAQFPEGSTKVKALNLALSHTEHFDIAIIMDADNVVEPSFLTEIDRAFSPGVQVVQSHRKAKSTETPFQMLDAISEEINNSIFRQGHYNAGLSAALIGSGMAFDFDLIKSTLSHFSSVGGFDKELEHVLLKQRIRFHYLPNTAVYDEKIKKPEDFSKQRRRWLSAQWIYLKRFSPHFFPAIREGNIDFANKILQMMMLPRVLFLGGLLFLSLLMTLIHPASSIRWWILSGLVVFSLCLAIPSALWNRKIFRAMFYLGHAFVLMLLNLFRLKGANKKFLHTPHGE